jgi:peptidoglycan/xylan/chitin deacetylase (PgdA/CDA1 family)
MKAIMYHYVRPPTDDLPYLRYLSLDNFRNQLDYFGREFGFVRREEFLRFLDGGPLPTGALLTFDDGFSDHVMHVLPELEARKLWGIFYIPTGFFETRKLLQVHRVHVLIGRTGGTEMLSKLRAILRPEMIDKGRIREFDALTYIHQDNDEATTQFKRILNYFIGYEWQDTVLDQLMPMVFGDEGAFAGSFYLSADELSAMQDRGMVVGSHSVSHPVFSRIAKRQQEQEIADSFAFLEGATRGLALRTFCYPYGGFHSFTRETEQILTKNACRFAFNVEPRDISLADLRKRPQALPRYDCNLFPHGQASMGGGPH